MRLHDFECQDCGHVFEELVGTEDETVECPKCSSVNTRRRLSGFHHSKGGHEGAPARTGHSHGGIG
jgi:putative FmdB family regulatory protein